MAVAWQPLPKLSRWPVQVVLAVEDVAPPTMVVMVYGRATGAAENGMMGAALTVMVIAGLEVEAAKFALAT